MADDYAKVPLNEQEQDELRKGQELYEMTKSSGFRHLKDKLTEMAFHSWVDPREIVGPEAEKEYMWRELNAFYGATNAKELLEWIQEQVSRSEYLEKKKSGEIQVKSLRVG